MHKKLIVLLMFCSAMSAAELSFHRKPAVTITAPMQTEHVDTIDIQPEFYLRRDSLVNTALKYLGKRYLSGHRGPHAFDCSGFTSFIYALEGIQIGRSSRDQFLEGEKVAIKDLQKGDLVFFANPGKKTRINHVGIVTDVDNENNKFNFIHACRRGVTIDTYPDVSYYVKRYVSARRIITD